MGEYVVCNDELYHHGVKGMKWGIRRYQNTDGSLTNEGRLRYQKIINKSAKKGIERSYLTEERTIPSGTKMYRTSVNKDEHLSGSTYVTYTDVDRNHYKGGWIRQVGNSDKAYEHQYTLKEDLKIPSRAKQQDVINQVVKSNKKYLHEAVKSFVDELYPEGTWTRFELNDYYDGGIKKYVEDMVTEWGKNTPEQLAFSVCQSLGKATSVKKEIINELQKQGYNAMADEASIGGRNDWRREGYDPLIIFDSSVLAREDTKRISKMAENKALNRYNRWNAKVNRDANGSAEWSAI